MKISISGLLLWVIVVPAAHADLLVYYDNPALNSLSFDSGIPQPALATHSLVVASDLTNTGVQGVNHIEGYQTNGWPTGADLDPDKYISFSLTPLANHAISFDSFSIDMWEPPIFGSTARQFSLRWDYDGYATDILSTVMPAVQNPTSVNYQFSLADLSERTTESEFRLYFYDAPWNDINAALIAMGGMGNGLTLTGTVREAPTSVPAPSTVILIAIALLLAPLGRRRRNLPPANVDA